MKPVRCTIDTSCVIALDALELLPHLSFLFSRVLLPKAVRTELFRRRQTKDRLQSLLRSYAFIERCDNYDQGAVDVLLIERAREAVEDRGETEAVVQAAAIGAMVIADDPWGRRLAARFDLECHGTLWVLRRLFDMRFLTGSAVRDSVSELRMRGIRLPVSAVQILLQEIGQPPFSNPEK